MDTFKLLCMAHLIEWVGVAHCTKVTKKFQGVYHAQGTIDLYALEFDNQNEMVMIMFFESLEVMMKV